MPTTDSRPANGARAPFSRKRRAKPDDTVEAVQPIRPYALASIDYSFELAATDIADGVIQQINSVGARFFSETVRYPTQHLLEEVIKVLQSRV